MNATGSTNNPPPKLPARKMTPCLVCGVGSDDNCNDECKENRQRLTTAATEWLDGEAAANE